VLNDVFNDLAVLAGAVYLPFQQRGTNTTASVVATTAALAALLGDLDALLATDVNFMVGPWIADARRWADSPALAASREFNARNQITLWGPTRENILDYASKHWCVVGNGYTTLSAPARRSASAPCQSFTRWRAGPASFPTTTPSAGRCTRATSWTPCAAACR
jgi:hypothetical protein